MKVTIDQDSVRRLVRAFYDDVRADDQLAPIFEAAIGVTDEEWQPHLEKIGLFWCGVMLGTKGYTGNPLQIHKRLPPFDARLFSRWVAIFSNTAIETHDIASATAFIRKALNIAGVMTHDLYGKTMESFSMPLLPQSVEHYHTSPLFLAEQVPQALRKAHRTAPGVYGKIVVIKGSLLYTIGKHQCHIITPETTGVIEPEAFHFVTPLSDDTAFKVEFYKEPLSLSKGASSS